MHEIELLPVSGKNIHTLYFNDEEKFHGGGGDEKFRVKGFIGNKNVSLVKRLDFSYSDMWKLFKENDLPVIPMLRKDVQDYYIYQTDLKANGGEIYGKGTLNVLEKQILRITDNGYRQNSREIDPIFIKLTSNAEYKKIETRAKEISNNASRKKIYLPWDDPFDMIVERDESWKILSSDLETGGRYPNSEAFERLSTYFKIQLSKTIEDANNQSVDFFLKIITKIRFNLLK